MCHGGGFLSEREMLKMMKVAKAQGSTGSTLSFSNLWHLAAPSSPSSCAREGGKGAQLCLCRKRRPTFLLGTSTIRATLVTSPVSGARATSYCWISWEVKGTRAIRVCDLHPPPSSACSHPVPPTSLSTPGPHSPPASPHSPLSAAAASPALQSCGPGKPEPRNQRAQSQMGVGP